jgi:hypothetical protein
VPFERSIEVTLDHGFHNTMEGDYASVAYWYQEEPHADFPELPALPLRRVAPPLLNVLQHVLLAGALLAVVGLGAALARAAFALFGR